MRIVSALTLAALALGCGRGGDKEKETRTDPPPSDAGRPAAAVDAARAVAGGDAGTGPRITVLADPGEALAAVVGADTRLLGVGELHERTGAAPVESATARFRRLFEDRLAARTSDLIVEVWARDACGAKSEQASREVQQMTQRPPATENDVIALLKSAKARGVQNHVLEMHCADYDSILDDKKQVDFEKLLLLVTRKLLGKALLVTGKPAPAPGRDLVVVYGGGLHNNRYPDPAVADLSYVPSLIRQLGTGYVELDLYVPEYADGDPVLGKEPWYGDFRRLSGPGKVLLIERGPGSFILILERGKRRAPP